MTTKVKCVNDNPTVRESFYLDILDGRLITDDDGCLSVQATTLLSKYKVVSDFRKILFTKQVVYAVLVNVDVSFS